MLGYKKVKKMPRVLNLTKDITVDLISSGGGYYLYSTAKLKDGFASNNEAHFFLDKLKKYFSAYTVDLYYANFTENVPEALELPLKQAKVIVYNGVLASSKPTGLHPAALYTLDLTPMLGGSNLDSINFVPVDFVVASDESGKYSASIAVKFTISI